MTIGTEKILTSLAWVGGVFFVMVGVSSLFGQPATAVWWLALGLWLLPPVRKAANGRFPSLSYPVAGWGIGLVLFVSGVAFSSEKATPPTPAANQVELPDEVEPVIKNTENIADNKKPDTSNSPSPVVPASDGSFSAPQKQTASTAEHPLSQTSAVNFTVTYVTDGDTLKLDDGETVRLIGINTPEVGQSYYEEATEALKSLVLGKIVQLEKDVSDKDRYGRRLSYVYVGDVFVNEALVAGGFAKSYPYEPDTSKQDVLRAAELDAQAKKLGMWAPAAPTTETGKGVVPVALAVSAFNYDSPGNDNDTMTEEYFILINNGGGPVDLSGYKASDAANHEYFFPDFVLPSGASVAVRTGSGQDSNTDLYWGSDKAIWNNSGDTLYLFAKNGELITSYSY